MQPVVTMDPMPEGAEDSVDPNDRRYPRRGIVAVVRGALVAGGHLFLGYVSLIGYNVYALAHGNLANLTDARRLREALLLPGPATWPLWVYLISVPFAVALMTGYVWALRDIWHEIKVRRARDRNTMPPIIVIVVVVTVEALKGLAQLPPPKE